MTGQLWQSYYAAFNRGDSGAMLNLLTDDVVHEPSQGAVRRGKAAFAEFLDHMNRCYKEEVIDPVFLLSSAGDRAAVEFMLEGRYLQSDADLPPASGQRYRLRIGAFFEVHNHKITRVSNHYNLADWIAQVQ
ncbi:ketosteroid isomerase-related protein [Sphingobium fuliginis]|uniref:Isopropylmalate synthase n=1 Tax=Sphingobium fuliginis (strain ATCC 27551) TaxID=336203 RepID=A0A292ZGE1_SPHSA|nr:ketosteroid isomerase-related protein [Sphingobium fuliginis]GAY22148.1 isopropylmalate synthase [Sphingobium fuliginis]